MMGPASSMNTGHSRPSSNDNTVPETAPTANRMAPSPREIQVLRSSAAEPRDLRGNHHHRHRHADHGEDDVEGQRQAHLPARVQKIHGGMIGSVPNEQMMTG